MSTKIRILPESLTNKIAAGEVVERPASVAKELVENALDAGTKEVVVEIESGGRKLIKVSDTGSGMSREDALLALERHATSKIACDDDLFSLATLGFRGEALPSIASVSRLTIATRTPDNVEGTEIYAEGGRIKEVKGCGMAAGTVISVRNLFFNTPARLKFMKSAETEGGHVGELLTRLAISRPDVRFTYRNDGKVVFRALDADLKDRVAALLGRSIAASLYPVSYETGSLKVTGLVAAPESSRSAASHLYTYINGRFIRDKVVQHAILQAYRNFLERGRYPVVAVFIEIDPAEVDVNVHPTKHEVRFREQGKVHDAIQFAVESVLKETPWIKRAQPAQGVMQPPGGAGRGDLPGSTSRETPAVAAGKIEAAKPSGNPVLADPRDAVSRSVSEAKVAEVRELLVNYQPRPQPPLRAYDSSPFKLKEPQERGAEPGVTFPMPLSQNREGAGDRSRTPSPGHEEGAPSPVPFKQDGAAATSSPFRDEESTLVPSAAKAEGGVLTSSASMGKQSSLASSAAVGEESVFTSAASMGEESVLTPAAGTGGDRAASPSPCKEDGALSPSSCKGEDGRGTDASAGYFSSLSVIGQFNASYILCQRGTDLVLIDQHAAHERVAFEKLKGQFANKQVDSQGLLFPETMELSFRESAVLLEHQEELARLGFELEEFGGNTWLLKGVPQLLAATDYLRTVRDILEELGSLGRSRAFTEIQEEILTRIACHSVVRGRRTLTSPEIAALFRQMDETDFSSNCPHGRPVMQTLTLAEIEKMFKR